jgi:hypothetical protein
MVILSIGLDAGHEEAVRQGAVEDALGARDAEGEGAAEGLDGEDPDGGTGVEVELAQVAEELGVAVGYLDQGNAAADGGFAEGDGGSFGQGPIARGDGLAVRVGLGLVEKVGKAVGDAVRGGVLKAVGLAVYLVPWEAEGLGEEELPEAVDAEEAEGLPAARGGEGDATVGDVVDQATAVELADHAGDGGRGDVQVGSQGGGRDGRVVVLEPVDGLEIFFDGGGCLCSHY